MTLKVSNATYKRKPISYSFTSEKNGSTNKNTDLLNAVATSIKRNTCIMAKP